MNGATTDQFLHDPIWRVRRPSLRAFRRLGILFACSVALTACQSSPKAPLETYFQTSYENATKVSQSEKKPIVLVFSAPWCPPCQKMRQEVYPAKELIPYHDAFVWTYLDVDLRSNQKLMEQYQVHAIPHFVFLSPEGEVLLQSRGELDLKAMIQTLDTALKINRGEDPGKP